MESIPAEQVRRRLAAENPWWDAPHEVPPSIAQWRPRPYLDLFLPLVREREVRRAVVLMGPRRVGKTVLIHHVIGRLIAEGVEPRRLCYVSVDHPLYNGLGLEQLLEHYGESAGVRYTAEPCFVFFDEVQYLKQWEVHLKALVDHYPSVKCVASGSAAAALRWSSLESGAGRFTDFLLPPLTFSEFLFLLGEGALATSQEGALATTGDLPHLNQRFLDYLNFGGYPEAISSPTIQADPGRYIKSDIIDKVLLRDLPGRYGIQDIPELNYLFTTLAFNTGAEVSLEELSRNSGVAKNTIKRYIEYLEAAFLVRVIHRVGRDSRRFQRANFFKVYLTNPSIRSALFSPVDEDDPKTPALVETAVFSQWFHRDQRIHYARWKQGEVDLVRIGQRLKPDWALEVKWSDRVVRRTEELASLISFCQTNGLAKGWVTTKAETRSVTAQDVELRFVPASLYAFTVGDNGIRKKTNAVYEIAARDILNAPSPS